MIINRLDHLVLTIADITTTCNFYAEVRGMRIETFGKQKINLHQKGKEIEPTEGSADLCFIANTLITEVIEQLRDKDINFINGIETRTGGYRPHLLCLFP